MAIKDLSLGLGSLAAILCLGVLATSAAQGADWARFRGANGLGISADDTVPATWSDTENLKWKTELPGPGLSSPIVVADKVLITCYTGYGLDRENPGNMEDLKRHLICVHGGTGDIAWSQAIASAAPEDEYKGFITEHGYASHSPVSDGQRVYVFFGKSGALAFDLDGNQLWQTSVGTGSGRMKWGSAASPILYKNLVIVNASDESQSLVALDQQSGKEVWRETGPQLGSNWSTPVLVTGKDGTDLVLAVTGEVWGFDPATGQRKWKATGFGNRGYSTSLIAGDGIVYCTGGMLGGPSFAIRTGGSGDVTQSHVVWTGPSYEGIISPILWQGQLIGSKNDGIAFCVNAEDGKRLAETRLASGRPAADAAPQPGGEKGRPAGKRAGGRRGGRSSGPGGGEYASPVLVGGKVYVVTRTGTTYVVKPGDELEILATNQFTSDSSGFCGTPAVSNGKLYIRSNKYLYCIAGE